MVSHTRAKFGACAHRCSGDIDFSLSRDIVSLVVKEWLDFRS